MKLAREPSAVNTGPAERPPNMLDRVLRIVDSGPAPFFRAAMVSLAVTSLLGIAIALAVRPAGALPAPQRDTIQTALVVLVSIGVVSLAALMRPVRRRVVGLLDRVIAAPERAAIWLALAAWFPTLLIIAYFRAKATLPPRAVWLVFGFLDKRWETSACLLGALAPMLLLVAAARVLTIGRQHPPGWRSWLAGLVPRSNAPQAAHRKAARRKASATAADTGKARAGRFVRIGAGIFTALGLAYYFYGPPWYLRPGVGRWPYRLSGRCFPAGHAGHI